MHNFTITTVSDLEGSQARELVKNLVAYNDQAGPKENWEGFLFVAKDTEGQFIGGIKGYTHWSWLFISHLWVSDEYKGQGVGSRLVEHAENLARQRNCHKAWLDTFSFQALDFYLKLGYQEFTRLEDYPPGQIRHFLKKDLSHE